MKQHFSIVLLILTLFTLTGSAQVPMKKANQIIIKTADDIDLAFKKFGRLLLNEGYDLAQSDKTFYLITTSVAYKKYGVGGIGSLEIKLQAEFDVKDDSTVVFLSGRVNSAELNKAAGGNGGKFDRNASAIEYRGMKGSVSRDAWKYMNELATKYKDGSLSYKIVN